ncbi:hypothetical protein [Parasedimentitalea denitrificans]|uniref:hypothetical protein n=1 Tax=Parasedimentitalea denitrificans TaxID=2211118 RepID=UPI0019809900|nr:hypothetical protein [Sedimentitalea sp. CY04]
MKVTAEKFDNFLLHPRTRLSGRLACLAGRDIEMPNAFDLLASKLFFLTKEQLSDEVSRLSVAQAGADTFSFVLDNQESEGSFEPLYGELSWCWEFWTFFEPVEIKEFAIQMVALWNDITNYCVSNAEKSKRSNYHLRISDKKPSYGSGLTMVVNNRASMISAPLYDLLVFNKKRVSSDKGRRFATS